MSIDELNDPVARWLRLLTIFLWVVIGVCLWHWAVYVFIALLLAYTILWVAYAMAVVFFFAALILYALCALSKAFNKVNEQEGQ